MKNKKVVASLLFIMLVSLIAVTGWYSYMNRDKFLNNNPSLKEEEVIEKKIVPGESMITVGTYSELEALLNRDDITYLVLGREGCHYCSQYKPVLEETAKKYKLEIVYVDLASFSKEDYSSIMHSGLTIPSKCTDSGNEIELSQGFGTPLTLFVKNGASIDCIRGYKDENTLSKLLIKNGYVKEA